MGLVLLAASFAACGEEATEGVPSGDGGIAGAGGPGSGADAGLGGGGVTGPRGQTVGTTPSGADLCGGVLAETTFRFGLCLCEDLAFASALYTDGYRSSQGPYAPGGPGGSVGVNGLFRSYGQTNIGGSLHAGTDVRPIGDHDVRGDLHAGGKVTAAGDIHVFHDGYVAGDIVGIRTKFDGTLHIPAASSMGLATEVGAVVHQQVTVPLPCDCDPTKRVDVAGFVASARLANDNAKIGLTPGAWTGLFRTAEIALPPGKYYVDGVETLLPIKLHVTGPTALYIGGDLKSASIFEIVMDGPAGEMDIFIAGDVVATGDFELGTAGPPSKVRTYVAGSGDIRMLGDLDFGGNLYAPRARIVAVGPLEVFGSIQARALVEAGYVKLHFDTDILHAGDTCEETPATPATPPSQVPPPTTPPPSSCTSCLDCRNQACTGGQCGACTSSADCCAPLVCDTGRGACITLSL